MLLQSPEDEKGDKISCEVVVHILQLASRLELDHLRLGVEHELEGLGVLALAK